MQPFPFYTWWCFICNLTKISPLIYFFENVNGRLDHWYTKTSREFSWSCELTILLLNWVRICIISQLIGGEYSEITPNCSHLIDTKGPGVAVCQWLTTVLLSIRWNGNDCRKKLMTNFNIRMVLDGKGKLVTAWSLVRPTSHRVDTHTHAHTICKPGIADTIVSKSYACSFLKRLIARNVAQRGLKLWWPESECASVFVRKKWRLQQDCEQVMERAPRQMWAAIFKKKNVVGEKASKSAYD